MVSELGDPMISEGEYTVSIGGGQPGTEAPAATAKLKINGSVALPE
jgi:beta-glucosidase